MLSGSRHGQGVSRIPIGGIQQRVSHNDMITVLLVIHLLIAIALVITVLLQPSEGGGLGIGGGSGGGGGAGLQGFLSGRGTANLLTRTTAVLAASFMATSIVLTILAGGGEQGDSILDQMPAAEQPVQPETGGSGDSGEAQGGPEDGDGEPTVPVQ